MRALSPVLLCLALGACNIWPSSGTGGYAEYDGTNDTAELAAATARYDHLAEGPVGAQYPADMTRAHLLLVRATRATSAELEPAASQDLANLNAALDALEARQGVAPKVTADTDPPRQLF
ncbi:MAG: hypothetical protein U1E45_04650 [Geminicoccaceae bacterium]